MKPRCLHSLTMSSISGGIKGTGYLALGGLIFALVGASLAAPSRRSALRETDRHLGLPGPLPGAPRPAVEGKGGAWLEPRVHFFSCGRATPRWRPARGRSWGECEKGAGAARRRSVPGRADRRLGA